VIEDFDASWAAATGTAAQRAQTARTLLETTRAPVTDVAFAAGFGSLRQFNATIRAVFDHTPTELRRRARPDRASEAGELALRLRFRAPLDAEALLGWLAARAVPGVEEVAGDVYRRSLRLPRGPGVVELAFAADCVRCRLWLEDLRDLTPAVQGCRRLLDLDADPGAVAEHLDPDPLIGPLVRAAPGLRVPGHVDGAELAVRAVLGQQISVPAARTGAGRLVAEHGEALAHPRGAVTALFPAADVLAALDPGRLGMPRARAEALVGLCRALTDGELRLDAGADRGEARPSAASGRGPRATWPCAHSAIPTSSSPRTSACAMSCGASAGPTIRGGRPSWRRRGRRGARTPRSSCGRRRPHRRSPRSGRPMASSGP
jgi:AraC family transcriptional regulator, regulatory protein of adaptative response / DNA-3-methyladenine glycosylase II